METKKKVLLTGAALLAAAPVVVPDVAYAASKNIDIKAIVLRTIQLTQVDSLDFGTFSVNAAGNIALPAGGGAPVYTNATPAGVSTPTDAVVQIKASKGYDIDLSVTAATNNISNGTATMAVKSFKIDDGANMGTFASAQTVTAKLTANTGNFEVGATLHFGLGQAAGTYTGTFTVNAAYQ